MLIQSGIQSIIDLYNFFVTNLIKDKLKFRVNNGFIEVTQDGIWTLLPESLNEVMIIPPKFKEGYVRKSDLIELYDSLEFIVGKKGRISDSYMESYVSPEVFGFTVWSRYPNNGIPGVKKVQSFKFKVRNKFGFVI